MADHRRGPAATLALALLLAGLSIRPAAAFGSPVGLWSTEDHGGVVQIMPCGKVLCGTIVGLRDWPADGSVRRDYRGTPQCHLHLLDNLRWHGDDRRWHGSVTNPLDGRVYDAEVWVADDGVLRLRGYVGLPLLGSTQHWQSFSGTVQPDCHFTEPGHG